MATLNGQGDQSGNTSGLTLLNQSNGGIFEIGCGFSGCADENGTTLASGPGASASRTINTILTHTWTNVPVNMLVSLTLGIESASGVVKNFNDGGFGESAFHNTVTFAFTENVFGLESGVTVNSEQLGLSDNSFASATIPESGILPVFAWRCALLGFLRVRKSR